MATDNPTWGEERIANELLLKIGIRLSPRTVGRYMPRDPQSSSGLNQRWSTFVHNHAREMIAADSFVVVTATLRLVYVLVIMEIVSQWCDSPRQDRNELVAAMITRRPVPSLHASLLS